MAYSETLSGYSEKFYVDYEGDRCVQDCDPASGGPCNGQRKSHLKLYESVDACCTGSLWWIEEECVTNTNHGGSSNAVVVTNGPSNNNSSTTSADDTTGLEPTDQYFADYKSGTCLKDCEPGPFGCAQAPPPVVLYGTIEDCCKEGQFWADFQFCISRSTEKDNAQHAFTDGWIVDFGNEKCGKSLSYCMKLHLLPNSPQKYSKQFPFIIYSQGL